MGKGIVGLLGASFSLREGQEPNPSNLQVASEVYRIYKELRDEDYKVWIVLQWEVAVAWRQLGYPEGLITAEIGQLPNGDYLGTREVYDEAREIFEQMGVAYFVGVAKFFIHQPYLYWLARKDFRLIWKRTRGVKFDRQSDQWWCRGPLRLILYTLRALTGAHGYNGKQAKA